MSTVQTFLESQISGERKALREEILKSLNQDPSILANDLVSALDSPVWMHRKRIAEIILQSKDQGLLCVQRALRSENDNKRYWGSWILRQLRTKEALKNIVHFLESSQKEIRFLALESLHGYLDIKGIIPLLTKSLDDPEWNIRSKAAEYLALIGKDAMPELKKAYVAASPDGKYWIIRVIGMIQKKSGDDIGSLINLLSTGDKMTKLHIMTALDGIDDKRLIPVLIRLLSDKDWVIRNSAADLLSTLGNSAAETVKKTINFEKPDDTTYFGIKVVANIQGAKSIKWFREIIEKNPKSEDIRFYILDAIALSHHEEAVNFLVNCFFDPFWNIRKKAFTVLKSFPERFIPILLSSLDEAIKDGDDDRIFWIVKTLFNMDKPGIIPITRYFEKSGAPIRRIIMSMAKDAQKSSLIMEMCVKALCDPIWTIRAQSAEILVDYGDIAIKPIVLAFREESSGDRGYWTEYILGKFGANYQDMLEKLRKESGVNHLADFGRDQVDMVDTGNLASPEAEGLEKLEEKKDEKAEESDIAILFDERGLNSQDISILDALDAPEKERQLLAIKTIRENTVDEKSGAHILAKLLLLSNIQDDHIRYELLKTIEYMVENGRNAMISLSLSAKTSIEKALNNICSALEDKANAQDSPFALQLAALLFTVDEMGASALATAIEENPDSPHIYSALAGLSTLACPDIGRVALKFVGSQDISKLALSLNALKNRGIIGQIPQLIHLILSDEKAIVSALIRFLLAFEEKAVFSALIESAGHDKISKKAALTIMAHMEFMGAENQLINWIPLAEDEEILGLCLLALSFYITPKSMEMLENIHNKLGPDSKCGAFAQHLMNKCSTGPDQKARSFNELKEMDYFLGFPEYAQNRPLSATEESGEKAFSLHSLLEKREEVKNIEELKNAFNEMLIRLGELVVPLLKKGELDDQKSSELFIQLRKYDYLISEKVKKESKVQESFMGKLKGAIESATLGSRESQGLKNLRKKKQDTLLQLGNAALALEEKSFGDSYEIQDLIENILALRNKIN